MLTSFKFALTILLMIVVVGLIGSILDSKSARPNLLIGATVFCSLLFTAFVWGVGIFSPVP